MRMYERALLKPALALFVRAYDQLTAGGYAITGGTLHSAMIGQTFYSCVPVLPALFV
jgi:hypothetical protein